ncbi:MAG: hypothetical protein ACQETR_04110 [Thermodesulfobacteriota bacterium]
MQATSTGPRAMLSQRSVSLNNACFPAVYISSIIEMGDPPHLPDRPLQRKIGVIIDTGQHWSYYLRTNAVYISNE